MSVTTSYTFVENGVDKNGDSSGNGGNYKFFGWSGPFTWTITFPVPIENVTEIDLSVLPGIIRNSTLNYAGALRIRVFDDSGAQIAYQNSSTVPKNSSINISTMGAMTLTGETVGSIKILGPSNTGPNLVLSNVTTSSTYTITTIEPVPVIEATMYTHLADITWDEISGVSAYRITQSQDGGTETDIITDTTDLSGSVFVENTSSYVFSVYTDDSQIVSAISTTYTPSIINEASVTLLVSRLSNDLTSLTETAILEIEDHISSSLTHLDNVKTRVSTGTGETVLDSIYLGGSETTSVEEGSYLFSFTDATGSGQTTTMVTPDSVVNEITYNETTSDIIFDGTSYGPGESFIMGGLRAVVYDVV